MTSVLAHHNSTSPIPTSHDSSYRIRGTHVTLPYPANLTPAETRLVFALEKHFPSTQIFPDYYTEKVTFRTKYNTDLTNLALATNKSLPGSSLVQIDCIAVNRQGIFVFESKDYSGWIYGNGSDNYWTEVLSYGKEKYRFYNPVKQNSLHLAALTDFLPQNLPFYSIIVFGRDATLRSISNLPDFCHVVNQSNLRSLLSHLSSDPPALSKSDLDSVISLLNTQRTKVTPSMRAFHAHDIADSLKFKNP